MLKAYDDRDGHIWMDGKLVPWRNANVHILTHALHYGSSVFEGERAYNGKIFKSEEHTKRLFKSAETIGIKIPYTQDEINKAKNELITKMDYKECYVRPFAWRGGKLMGLSTTNSDVSKFIKECNTLGTSEAAIEQAEKKGFETKLFVHHPLINGLKVPVYIANFVLMDYGTGAIFGCPAHDQRDLDFARKYNLPVKEVVCPDGQSSKEFSVGDVAYTGSGTLINSGDWDGLDIEKAKKVAIDNIIIFKSDIDPRVLKCK